MPIINNVYQFFIKKRLEQVSHFSVAPVEIQMGQLKQLIKRAKETQWGKKYDYRSISSVDIFRERVPLHKYEDIYPQIEEIRKGKEDIMWPGKVKWFAKSSGTTNDKSKFIPVTNDSLDSCHYRGGKDVIGLYLRNFPNSKILTGKTLTLGGSHQLDNFNEHARSGDLSAIMLQNIPLWADLIRTPPRDIVLIPRWEEKLEKFSKYVLKQKVTALAGVPSWNLVMIKYLLSITGKSNLLELWSELELFMHGGVNFIPYRLQYERLIPTQNMHYMETYNASEGFFAIQDDPSDNSLQLMLDYGIFYEFIPMDKYYSGCCDAKHIGEVQTGVNYAMVISTNGGLWRYIIGDTVMFTSLYPHKIIITGRTRHFINAFGEEIIIDNAEKALAEASKETGALILEYTAAPVYMDSDAKGSHEWLIEFEKEPDDLDKFAEILDKTLMSINSDYEAKRYKNITLDAPIVKMMRRGTFYKWFSVKGKLGGQNKIPRLSNDRRYVEELMHIIETYNQQ